MPANLFYKNLKYLRRQKRFTQEEMGKILGVKRSTYAHMESYGTRIVITPELRQLIYREGYSLEEFLTTDLGKIKQSVKEPKEVPYTQGSEEVTTLSIKEIDEALLTLDELAIKLNKIKLQLTI